MRLQSRRTALCGLMAALSIVLLSAGALIPAALYACPILAMAALLPLRERFGVAPALTTYAAVSLLAMLIAPDKEVALLYVFLGWYPPLRPAIDRAIGGKVPRLLVKSVLFAAAVSAMYALDIFVLGMEHIAREYAEAGQTVLALTAALGFAVWLLFDKVLLRFTLLYRHKWRKRLLRV